MAPDRSGQEDTSGIARACDRTQKEGRVCLAWLHKWEHLRPHPPVAILLLLLPNRGMTGRSRDSLGLAREPPQHRRSQRQLQVKAVAKAGPLYSHLSVTEVLVLLGPSNHRPVLHIPTHHRRWDSRKHEDRADKVRDKGSLDRDEGRDHRRPVGGDTARA